MSHPLVGSTAVMARRKGSAVGILRTSSTLKGLRTPQEQLHILQNWRPLIALNHLWRSQSFPNHLSNQSTLFQHPALSKRLTHLPGFIHQPRQWSLSLVDCNQKQAFPQRLRPWVSNQKQVKFLPTQTTEPKSELLLEQLSAYLWSSDSFVSGVAASTTDGAGRNVVTARANVVQGKPNMLSTRQAIWQIHPACPPVSKEIPTPRKQASDSPLRWTAFQITQPASPSLTVNLSLEIL